MSAPATRLAVAALAALAALGAGPRRQPDDPVPRIEAFVAAEMRRSAVPGLALAVVKDARPLIARGYGLANVEHQVPVRRDTVFQSGSVAKQFTATAVLQLVEDGRLSLDAPIDAFFAPAPEPWRRITVRHLLSHTSGMQDYPENFDLRRDYTEDELLGMIKAAPLAFAPGERCLYSNLGYVTLGSLIRRVTGRFYGDVLAERIFTPLGMKTARVISEADIVPNRAAGYRLVRGALKNQDWVAPSVNTTADGSLYLALDDMLKWDAALTEGRPLGKAALERMWSPARLADGRPAPYGFGWFTVRSGEHRIVFHGGAWQGFKAFVARFPDDGLSVILFANSWQANEWRLARGVAAVFIPQLALGAAPAEDAEPAVTQLARKVLRQLLAGAPAPDLFTAEGRAALSPPRVHALAEQLAALSLPEAIVSSIDLVGRSESGGLRVHRYALTDITATEILVLRLAADGRIASLDLQAE